MKLELRVVARSLGLLLVVLSAVIALVAVFSAYEKWVGRPGESTALVALLATTFLGALVGGLFYLFGKRAGQMLGQREALLLVAASWILGAGLAALPFRIWAGARSDAGVTPHDFDTYIKDEKDTGFIGGMDPDWSSALPASWVYDGQGNKVSFWEGKADYERFEAEVLTVLK